MISFLKKYFFKSKKKIKDCHILVAEDNKFSRMITSEILKDMGCSIDIVTDGSLALEAVQQKNYDLVFMDVRMPVMNGFKAAEEISDLVSAKMIKPFPVIALTADVMKEDEWRCIAAGMTDYISKPIRKDELKRVVLKHLPSNKCNKQKVA